MSIWRFARSARLLGFALFLLGLGSDTEFSSAPRAFACALPCATSHGAVQSGSVGVPPPQQRHGERRRDPAPGPGVDRADVSQLQGDQQGAHDHERHRTTLRKTKDQDPCADRRNTPGVVSSCSSSTSRRTIVPSMRSALGYSRAASATLQANIVRPMRPIGVAVAPAPVLHLAHGNGSSAGQRDTQGRARVGGVGLAGLGAFERAWRSSSGRQIAAAQSAQAVGRG